MAGEENVARVYARALYDAARDAGRVEVVRRDMGAFAAAVASSRPLRDVLLDPQIDAALHPQIQRRPQGAPTRTPRAARGLRNEPWRRARSLLWTPRGS